MILFYLSILSYIAATPLNLQDVFDEGSDQTVHVGLTRQYSAKSIKLETRNATLIGMASDARLDLEAQPSPAFHLVNSTLKLANLKIVPSLLSPFAEAVDHSHLTIEQCTYATLHFTHPILVGDQSTLVLSSMTFDLVTFHSSLIAQVQTAINPTLSISLHFCSFTNSAVAAQSPIVAGSDVAGISISDSTFLNISCHSQPVMPLEPVNSASYRHVEIVDSRFNTVEGPLAGGVVFGVQAHSLHLRSVKMSDCSNAVHFWERVPFPASTAMTMSRCSVTQATTTAFQPNGSFLFFVGSTVSLNITSCSFSHCTARQSGGCVWVTTSESIDLFRCRVSNCSAGGNGGFLCCSESTTNASLRNNSFSSCSAEGKTTIDRHFTIHHD
ncbi:hypothetical protein BLNAU_1240 [Blattamonas nauphoetae]|uniref:Right handed beta helix domain-containing protein n=1 Tax=Blattamonas nauphoetae TaxID=2049346 RepID=A0ABQ9YIX0_9EUKA|nr:hypothetical protein BLNAU_1240 [Blattamonas nauphoetae]